MGRSSVEKRTGQLLGTIDLKRSPVVHGRYRGSRFTRQRLVFTGFFAGGTVTGTQMFEACVSITTGPDWTVDSSGVVTLTAGSLVQLGEKTTLGGTVTIALDGSL